MRGAAAILLAGLYGLAVPAAAQDDIHVYLQPHEALTQAFPDVDRVLALPYEATAEQRERLREALGREAPERLPRAFVALKDDRLAGLAFQLDEIGKVRPITFLTALDAGRRVRRTLVMVYRESIGSEVRAQRFLSQFEGKRREDARPLVRRTIHIAGATLSSKAIARGIALALVLAETCLPGDRDAEHVERARAAGERDLRTPPEPKEPDVQREQAQARIILGSLARIDIAGPGSGRTHHDAREAAFEAMEEVEGRISTWRPESEISALERRPTGEWLALSGHALAVLEEAQRVHRWSGGAFDITVRPLVEAWGFRAGAPAWPQPAALRAARARVGQSALEVDAARGRARLLAPRSLDLGAIAKGRAVDAAAAVLRQRGVRQALIDLGGTLLALGAPEGLPGWPVWLRHPRHSDIPAATLWLRDAALSVSGDDQQFFLHEGRRYAHVIDPRSGQALADAGLAAVLAPTAARADAMATALLVDPDLIERLPPGCAALRCAPAGAIEKSLDWPVDPGMN